MGWLNIDRHGAVFTSDADARAIQRAIETIRAERGEPVLLSVVDGIGRRGFPGVHFEVGLDAEVDGSGDSLNEGLLAVLTQRAAIRGRHITFDYATGTATALPVTVVDA